MRFAHLMLPLTFVILTSCLGSVQSLSNNASQPSTDNPSPSLPEAPPESNPREIVYTISGKPPATVSEVENLGGYFASYEQNFSSYSESHWNTSGADWAVSNYYDRAKIYYVWWARTGNATYKSRADQLALDYRQNYLVPANYGSSAHWSQLAGVAIHYLVSGDTDSKEAVKNVALNFSAPYYFANLGDTSAEMDNRIQARVLTSYLYAWKINATSAGVDWAEKLRTALDRILASQSADGAYRFTGSIQCSYNKPFMVGLLNDALIEYYENFEPDVRIPAAIKKSLDYMWDNDWDSGAQAFRYLGGPCPGNDEGLIASPDLNGMMTPGFGFVFKLTGDVNYKNRGDAVFYGGVNGAWLTGGKQFNESYTNSYKYLEYRK